jgi:hypothetical protein
MPAKLKTFKSNRAAGNAALFFASAIVINARADAGFDVGFDFHGITSLQESVNFLVHTCIADWKVRAPSHPRESVGILQQNSASVRAGQY